MIWNERAGDPMPSGWNFLVGYLTDPRGINYQVLLVPEPDYGPDLDVPAAEAEYEANQAALRAKK